MPDHIEDDDESLTTILLTTKPPTAAQRRAIRRERRLAVRREIRRLEAIMRRLNPPPKKVYKAKHQPSDLDNKSFKAKLAALGSSQGQFARATGLNEKTVKDYAAGVTPIPKLVELAFLAFEMKPSLLKRHKGESGPGSGLTEEQRQEALRLLDEEGASLRTVARAFRVHKTVIFRLNKKRRTNQNATTPPHQRSPL